MGWGIGSTLCTCIIVEIVKALKKFCTEISVSKTSKIIISMFIFENRSYSFQKSVEAY